MKKVTLNQIRSGTYGFCTGDALGVPVEFRTRSELQTHPLTEMRSGGTHGQPAGTWSDDSSMALCLMASLGEKEAIDYQDIMDRFTDWYYHGAYTPFGDCFDCGNTCGRAINNYRHGTPAAECGETSNRSNGNGSLMRILPLAYPLYDNYGRDLASNNSAMRLIHTVSGLTHRHPIAQSSCGIYLCIAVNLLDGFGKEAAIRDGIASALAWYRDQPDFADHIHVWDRLKSVKEFQDLPEDEIGSSGYCVDTLEAALWCLLNTDDYSACVLKAVNLGSDTDTTATVAGGLAGLIYGFEGIPSPWINALQKPDLIEECCTNLAKADIRL